MIVKIHTVFHAPLVGVWELSELKQIGHEVIKLFAQMPTFSLRFATGTSNPMEKSNTKGCRMYFVTSKATSAKNGVVSKK